MNGITSKNGLRNIILHDSYIRSLRVKIKCHGHTNNTGANGAGKTSALLLIPIFNGARPEQIVDRSANKDSFLKYYLPNKQSMIVFEYERPTGLCCVVMYRHVSSTKYCYRFVRGSADETLFSEHFIELYKNKLDAPNILNELSIKGIEVSRQIDSYLDYCAVLHNQKDRLAKEASLRTLALNFSLCDRHFQLRHIGELTKVTLSKGQLINNFKTMLVDSFLSDDVKITAKPQHDRNISTIEDIRSLQAFNAEKPKLEEGIRQQYQIKNTLQDLATYRYQAVDLDELFRIQSNDLSAEKQQIEEHATIESNVLLGKKTSIHEQLAGLKGELTGATKQLEFIEKQEHEYLKENIEQKQRESEALESYKQTLENEQSHLGKLQDSQQQIIQLFESNKNNILQDAMLANDDVQKQLIQVNDSKDQLNTAQNNAVDSLRQEQIEEQQALANKHELALEAIETTKEHALEKFTEAKSYTEEENRQIAQFEDILYERKTSRQNESEQDQKLDQQFEQIKKQLKQTQSELDEEIRHCQIEEGKEAKLSQDLTSENTLISFLRNSEGEDWKQNVARVISPELFSRKDLMPQWDEATSDSFYGLRLDTTKLDLPQQAESLDELRERLNRQQQRVQNAKNRVNDKSTQCKQCDNEKKEIEINVALSKIALTKALKRVEESEQALLNKKEEIKKLSQLRGEEAKKELDTLKEQEKALKNEYRAENQVSSTKFSQKYEQLKSNYAQRVANLELEFKAWNMQLGEIEKNKLQQLRELEQVKNNALKEKGVDTELIRQANVRVTAAQNKVSQVKSYEKILTQYNQWLYVEFPRKEPLQQQTAHLQEKIEQSERDDKTLNAQLNVIQQRKQQQSKIIDEQLQKISDQQGQLTRLLKYFKEKLEDFPNIESVVTNPAIDFPWFISNSEQTLQRYENQAKILKDAYYAVQNALKVAQGSELDQQWRDRISKHQHRMESLPYYLNAMHEIEEMYHFDIPQKESITLQIFEMISNSLRNYYQSLRQFKNKVVNVSDALTQQINSKNPFTALENIQIKLEPVIEKYGFNDDLKQFVSQWEEYADNFKKLPDETLLLAFEKAVKVLDRSNIESDQIKSLVDLNISFFENKRFVAVRNDTDLEKGSSTGLSRLVVLVIFTALARHLCTDPNTVIHLPLDELGQIDLENSKKLLELMNQQNINLVCAQPQMDDFLSHYFVCKNDIDRKSGVRHFIAMPMVVENPLLKNMTKEYLPENQLHSIISVEKNYE